MYIIYIIMRYIDAEISHIDALVQLAIWYGQSVDDAVLFATIMH